MSRHIYAPRPSAPTCWRSNMYRKVMLNLPQTNNCDPERSQLLLYIGINLLDVEVEQCVVTDGEAVVVASLGLEVGGRAEVDEVADA